MDDAKPSEMAEPEYVRESIFNEARWLAYIILLMSFVLLAGAAIDSLDSMADKSYQYYVVAGAFLLCVIGTAILYYYPQQYVYAEKPDAILPKQKQKRLQDNDTLSSPTAKQRKYRNDFDSSSVENRMWCDECNAWRLSRRREKAKYNQSDSGGFLASMLILIIAFLCLGPIGLLVTAILLIALHILGSFLGLVLGLVVTVISNHFAQYLCTHCGSVTTKDKS